MKIKPNAVPLGVNTIVWICSLSWLTYGILIEDVSITVPSCFGVVFSSVGIITNFLLRNNVPLDLSNDEENKPIITK